MKIIMWDGEVKRCRKIEPATLNPGKIIIDEDETVDLREIIKIVKE